MKNVLLLSVVALASLAPGLSQASSGKIPILNSNPSVGPTVNLVATSPVGPNGGPGAVVQDVSNGTYYRVVLQPMTPSEYTDLVTYGALIFGEMPLP